MPPHQTLCIATRPYSGDGGGFLMTSWRVTIIVNMTRRIPLLPSPTYISPRVGPKPFEGLAHLPGHPQLINLYRRVTVFRDLVLTLNVVAGWGYFCLFGVQRASGRWREDTDLGVHEPRRECQKAGHPSGFKSCLTFDVRESNPSLSRRKRYNSLRKIRHRDKIPQQPRREHVSTASMSN